MTQHKRFTQLHRRALRRWGVVSAGAIAAAALVAGSPTAAWAAGATPSPHSGMSSNCEQDQEEQQKDHDNGRDH
ncbi:MAG: hypothetical protein HOY75_38205, partial [Streptomyces sp.]|nr:hypothetical protein [Streptomyces sp.]